MVRGRMSGTLPSRASRKSTPYETLLDRIRCGEVSEADKLVDIALAAEFGVSRMPVREALLRLVHEGYLVGTSRGFMLPRLSHLDISNIFEIRSLLEPRAAAAAAQAISSDELARLELANYRAQEAYAAGDSEAFFEANVDFRRIWLAAIPNRRLADTIARFVDHVQAIRKVTLRNVDSQHIAVGLLDDLMAGFRRRDALYVYDRVGRFIDRAQEVFFELNRESDQASKQYTKSI